MATVEKIRRDMKRPRRNLREPEAPPRLEASSPRRRTWRSSAWSGGEDGQPGTDGLLTAYASGLITLPEGMMEAEAAADPGRE